MKLNTLENIIQLTKQLLTLAEKIDDTTVSRFLRRNLIRFKNINQGKSASLKGDEELHLLFSSRIMNILNRRNISKEQKHTDCKDQFAIISTLALFENVGDFPLAYKGVDKRHTQKI